MCGICGIFNKNEKVSIELLNSMNETLYHRGPDSSGIFVEKNVGLAMRRLSIIDLKTGSQPHYNETKKVICVCNGEIYNFKELRSYLQRRGHQFYSHSDVEVIPHLYEEYGESFPEHLRGMFAIALYDAQLHILLLVRDRAGEKPLYYSRVKNNFYFASEIKALLKITDTGRDMNYAACYSYFQHRYISAPETVYNNIFKLNPAALLVLKNNTISISNYWDVHKIKIDTTISLHDAKDQLVHHLKTSVASQMISDVPLGAFLSGGVDSSIVVSLMQQFSNAHIKTFSIKFPEKSYDESGYARRVAEYLGTDHTEYEVDWNKKDSMIGIVEAFDEPFADSSAIPVFYLSKLTKDKVTVALSGDGGDELFGGYSRYRGMQLAMQYHMIPRIFRAPLEYMVTRVLRDSDEKIEVSIRRKILRFIKFSNEMRNTEGTFLPSIGTSSMQSLFTDDFYHEMITASSEQHHLLMSAVHSNTVLDDMMRHDFQSYLPDDILTKVDRMSMAHSLETRAPYLDKDVIEFAYSLPTHYKIHHGITKFILKEAFKTAVPKDILYRQKQGFVVPLAKWFKGELYDCFRDYVFTGTDSLFNQESIAKVLHNHKTGMSDNSDVLWTLFCFALWQKKNSK